MEKITKDEVDALGIGDAIWDSRNNYWALVVDVIWNDGEKCRFETVIADVTPEQKQEYLNVRSYWIGELTDGEHYVTNCYERTKVKKRIVDHIKIIEKWNKYAKEAMLDMEV